MNMIKANIRTTQIFKVGGKRLQMNGESINSRLFILHRMEEDPGTSILRFQVKTIMNLQHNCFLKEKKEMRKTLS